jgi:hypothetical protein
LGFRGLEFRVEGAEFEFRVRVRVFGVQDLGYRYVEV